MKEQPPTAKITRPAITGIFQRERLFRILDASQQRPITWVSGPAGSGKTTLVASYLDARRLPCLWYRMDQGDADIATFFYYLGLAAKATSPSIESLPLLTPEYVHGIPVFTKRFFENLCERLPLPVVLVFDNHQDVPDRSGFHDLMAYGLDVIPEGIRVIILSRNEPQQHYARLRANRKIDMVGWEDIRFTLDEFREAARRYGPGTMTDEAIVELHGKTRGWMAGLVLILEGSKRTTYDPAVLSTLVPEAIFDYFASEIFEKTEERMREFLLRTSVLPVMTARIAEKLTGMDGADEKLAQLYRSHYFVEMRSQDDPVYYYHPLFREFLLSKAKRILTRQEQSALQKNAAALLQEAGQAEHAAVLLHDAQDWNGLVELILEHAGRFLMQGRGVTLMEWLRGLPGEIIERTPWLLYWMGICSMPLSLAESRAFLERAFAGFKDRRDPQGLYRSWSGIMETFVYEWGDFTPVDHWISEAEVLLREHPEFGSPEIEARVTYGMFSALMYRQPQHPDMHLWEQRAKNVLLKSTDVRLRTMIGSQLLVYYTWPNGDLERTSFLLRTIQSTSATREVDPLSSIIWCTFEAAYYWMTASHDRCLRAVNDALASAEDSGIHVWDSIPCAVGAMINTTIGNFAEAQAYLDRMSAALNPNAFVTVTLYHYLAVFVTLFQGDSDSALEHARTAVQFGMRSGAPYIRAFGYFALGAVLQELDEVEEGAACLEKARTLADSIQSNTVAYLCSITRAQYLLQRGEDRAGRKALAEAMAIGRKHGYLNHSAWRSSVMAFLCAKALEAGIEVEYVEELIRKRALVPDVPTDAPDTWPWSIRIYALGSFSIIRDGKPLAFSRKAQKKPLELLQVLVAFGGTEVSEAQLEEHLWPDAEGDAAYRAFVTNLQRLRKLLGRKEAIELRHGRVSLDSRYCWVDVWAFDRFCRNADDAWKAGERDKALQSAQQALTLYRGPLLGGYFEEYRVVTVRESLTGKFLRCLEMVGQDAERAGDWEAAKGYYLQALEADDRMEEVYRLLMRSYAENGRYGEALQIYRRCQRMLKESFGAEPSPETQAIYEDLVGRLGVQGPHF